VSSNDEQLQIVVRAVDEATQTMKAVKDLVTTLGGSAEETATKTGKMSSAFSALGSVLQGIGIGIGIDLFNDLLNVVGRIVDAIPQAIEAGYAWASQMYQLQVETGMTAEQTSSLAAIMGELGVPIDSANRLFAMFGKNLDTNEKLFTSLGVATRTANGDYLDTYTIIHELQQAFSAHGDSLTKTAAAQELFSRTGYTMLDFLNLTDEQMKQLTIDAGNAGMILGGDTTDAAHRFGVEIGKLQNDVTGLETGIFAGVEPMLESFVDSFGAFIQAHMNDIIAFVVSVANFIGGVLSGLFGIDFGSGVDTGNSDLRGARDNGGGSTAPAPDNTPMKTPAAASSGGGGGSKAQDPYAVAIKAQTDAIDDQIAALTKLQAVETGEQKQADLQKAIADAQAQLADLQQSTVNTYGLSAAEQVKAQQKRAADIVTAQDKVTTTEVALADWKHQQDLDAQKTLLESQKQALADQLAAYQTANGAVTAGVQAIAPIVASTFTSLNSTLSAGLKDFSGTATQSLADGKAAAKDLKKNLEDLWTDLNNLVAPFVWLGIQLGDLNTLLAPVGGFGGLLKDTLDVFHGMIMPLGNMNDAFGGLIDKFDQFTRKVLVLKGNLGNETLSGKGNAEGAIFDYAQYALVGEGNEREYLLPQSKLNAFAAMAIAGASGPSGGGGSQAPIYLVMDKVVVARMISEEQSRQMPAISRGSVASL
jgi:hypothetical protein